MRTYFWNLVEPFCNRTLKNLIKWNGKSNKQIALEIIEFVYNERAKDLNGLLSYIPEHKPEFIAYFADYDWCLFCSLFGTMMQFPNGFPRYCRDLKQTLDEKKAFYMNDTPSMTGISQHIKVSRGIEKLPDYPKQINEHNALADARWNFELHKFLQTL